MNNNAPTYGYGSGLTGGAQSTSGGAPQSNGNPNLVERLIPTGGAILGGLGGALAGAVAAPFTGGVINPFDAGIAGASFGDTAGKAGENLITHQNIKNGLGGAALQGGIGQLTGEVGGKVASAVLSKVAGGAEAQGISSFMKQFAQGTMDRGTAETLWSQGIRNKASLDAIAPIITKGEGIVDNGINDSIANNGIGVDASGLTNHMNDWLNSDPKAASLVNDATKSRLLQGVSQGLKTLSPEGGGAEAVPQYSDPNSAFSLLKNWEGNIYNSGGNKTEQAGIANFWREASDNLRDATLNPSRTQGVQLTDDLKSQLLQRYQPSPATDVTGEPVETGANKYEPGTQVNFNQAPNTSETGDQLYVDSKGAPTNLEIDPKTGQPNLPSRVVNGISSVKEPSMPTPITNPADSDALIKQMFTNNVTNADNSSQLLHLKNNIPTDLQNIIFPKSSVPVTVSDDDLDKMLQNLDSSPLKKINNDYYNSLRNTLDSFHGQNVSPQDLRSVIAPLVRGSIASEDTDFAVSRVPGFTPKDILFNNGNFTTTKPVVGTIKRVVGSATNAPSARGVETSILNKISNVAGNPVLVGTGKMTGLGEGQASTGILPALSGAALQPAANLANDVAPPSANALQIPASLSNNNVQGQGANTVNPTPPNIFQSLVPGSGTSPAYQPQAIQALLGMFDPALLNSSVETNATNSANNITKVQAAESQLPQLNTLFNQAGGAQGPIGGLLSTLGAKIFGGAAGTYGPQAQQILSSISQETGIPSNELVAPEITQGKSSAQTAVANIQSLLQALGGTPQSGVVGAVTQ